MERSLIITKDGSHTISVPAMNVTYHSHYGAIQESMHVYIQSGLQFLINSSTYQTVNILEMGFGTGLNAQLTLIEAEERKQLIQYKAIELFPLSTHEASTLNYCEQLDKKGLLAIFERLHQCEWEKEISITPFFTIQKVNDSLLNFKTSELQHLIYFDAFAPAAQPELWTYEIFEKLFSMLLPEGKLVTYCSKGEVRRAMIAAGFEVEKIPGPPGKREMLRAIKNF